MTRYILKTFYGNKLVETYGKRSAAAIRELLKREEFHNPGAMNAWREPLGTVDRFEIYDNRMDKVFDGNIEEAINFVSSIR